jgi:hypothetical protein
MMTERLSLTDHSRFRCAVSTSSGLLRHLGSLNCVDSTIPILPPCFAWYLQPNNHKSGHFTLTSSKRRESEGGDTRLPVPALQ